MNSTVRNQSPLAAPYAFAAPCAPRVNVEDARARDDASATTTTASIGDARRATRGADAWNYGHALDRLAVGSGHDGPHVRHRGVGFYDSFSTARRHVSWGVRGLCVRCVDGSVGFTWVHACSFYASSSTGRRHVSWGVRGLCVRCVDGSVGFTWVRRRVGFYASSSTGRRHVLWGVRRLCVRSVDVSLGFTRRPRRVER